MPRSLDLDEARRLYESGMSCRQIGERIGMSYSRVAGHLREAGVPMRPSGRPLTTPAPKVNVQELVRLREAGATFPAWRRHTACRETPFATGT